MGWNLVPRASSHRQRVPETFLAVLVDAFQPLDGALAERANLGTLSDGTLIDQRRISICEYNRMRHSDGINARSLGWGPYARRPSIPWCHTTRRSTPTRDRDHAAIRDLYPSVATDRSCRPSSFERPEYRDLPQTTAINETASWWCAWFGEPHSTIDHEVEHELVAHVSELFLCSTACNSPSVNVIAATATIAATAFRTKHGPVARGSRVSACHASVQLAPLAIDTCQPFSRSFD